MPNGDNNFDLGNETPEADAIDQHLSVDADHQSGLDTIHLDAISDRDANEADLIDQATTVPIPEDIPSWRSTLPPKPGTDWA
jgi:hypothetical protein